jgi:hypothetical protein
MSTVASAALLRRLVLCLSVFCLVACQTTADVPGPSPLPTPVSSPPVAGTAGPPPGSGSVYAGGPSTGYGAGRGPFGGAGSAAPAGFATASQPTWQRTNVSTRQSVGSDGTVRTETTRTSVSFDASRAAGALGGLAASGGASGGHYVGMPGEWQMQADSNRSICRVTLYGSVESTEGAASSTGCAFGAPGQGITGWRYDGRSLYLLKPGSEPFRMVAAGPNRFDGSASLAFLTVRYALYR